MCSSLPASFLFIPLILEHRVKLLHFEYLALIPLMLAKLDAIHDIMKAKVTSGLDGPFSEGFVRTKLGCLGFLGHVLDRRVSPQKLRQIGFSFT